MTQFESNSNIEQIMLLREFGIKVFGNKENFESWLNAECPAVGSLGVIEIPLRLYIPASKK